MPTADEIVTVARQVAAGIPGFCEDGQGVVEPFLLAFQHALEQKWPGRFQPQFRVRDGLAATFDFYQRDEGRAVEVALTGHTSRTEFYKDMWKAVLVNEGENEVQRILFIGRYGLVARLAEPLPRAVVEWAERHNMEVEIRDICTTGNDPLRYMPPPTLQSLFKRRPFQGAVPETARFVFIGEDANFDADIETQPIWPELVRYLIDSVGWWYLQMTSANERERVHHPFLLPGANGDGWLYQGMGRPYHQFFHDIFNRESGDPKNPVLPLDEVVRNNIGFVEYSDSPNGGIGGIQPDVNSWHLGRITQLLIRAGLSKCPRTVFITKTAAERLAADSRTLYPGLIPEQLNMNLQNGPWYQIFDANEKRHRLIIHYHRGAWAIPAVALQSIRTMIRKELQGV